MNARVLTGIVIWTQMILQLSVFTLGVLYGVTLQFGLSVLSSLMLPLSYNAAAVLWDLYLVLWPLSVIIAIATRRYSKTPSSPESKERLQRLGEQALQRMRTERKVLFQVRERALGASALGSRIIFSERLLQRESDEEVVATLGHEIGHILKRHLFIKALMTWIPVLMFIIILGLTGESDSGFVFTMTVLSALSLARIPVSWKLEYDADAVASKRIGFYSMVQALEKLGTIYYRGVSFTHPPISKRIGRIQATAQSVIGVHIPSNYNQSRSVTIPLGPLSISC